MDLGFQICFRDFGRALSSEVPTPRANMPSVQREYVVKELIVAKKPYLQKKDKFYFLKHKYLKNKTEESGC